MLSGGDRAGDRLCWLRRHGRLVVASCNTSVKRKQTEMQRQLGSLADDLEWISRLARGAESSVESLRAELHAMQTAIEATMARKLAAMEASAAERCKKTIIEMMVMSEITVALPAPASGTSQVKCYVCLEDIEREEPTAHLCDQQSHAIHVECCRGILSAAGTDTGDGYHRFSRTATCGCCRQRRDGDVFAPLPQPVAVAESGASALQVQAVATGYAPAAPVPTTAAPVPPAAATPPLPPMLPPASDTPPDVPPIGSPTEESPSAEHQGDGAPTDEQAITDVVGMGFEQSMVESIAKRFRRAQKTKKDVLTTAILTELVLGAT